MHTTVKPVDRASSADCLRRLAASRDPEAWAQLLQTHGADILAVTRSVLRDPVLAEDAVQETLLLVRDHAPQFRVASRIDADAETQARTWIMRIACNAALQILRARRRAQRRDEEYTAQTAQRAADALTGVTGSKQNDAELTGIVLHELESLSDEHRLPVVLLYRGNLAYPEIARELRCPVATARTRVHRGLEQLRERLAGLGLLLAVVDVERLSALPFLPHAALDAQRVAQWQSLLASPRTAALKLSAAPSGIAVKGGISIMVKISVGVGLAACVALLATVARTHSQEIAPPAPQTPPQVVAPAQPQSVVVQKTPAPSDDMTERRRKAQENYERAVKAETLALATKLNALDVKEGEMLKRTAFAGDIYVFSRKNGELKATQVFDAEAARDQAFGPLGRRVTFQFLDQPLEDSANFLGTLTKIPIKFEADDKLRATPISLHASGMRISTALHWIAFLANCGVKISEKEIVFGGPPEVIKPADITDLTGVKELDAKITLDFVRTDFESAVEMLSQLVKVTIVLDRGLVDNGLAVTLSVKDQPIRDALKTMLDDCGAEASYQWGAVYIKHKPGAKPKPPASEPAKPKDEF